MPTKNPIKIKEQQTRWREKHRAEKNNRANERNAALRTRGVSRSRLREPRGLGKKAAALRWNRRISDDSRFVGFHFWEYMDIFGGSEARRIRERERFADFHSAKGPGAAWLRKNDPARCVPPTPVVFSLGWESPAWPPRASNARPAIEA
jgi:hypothetical protein